MTSENNKNILQKPSEESTLQNIYNTKKALEKLSNHRIKTYQSFKTNNLNVDSNKNNQLCYKYINYQFDSNNNNNSNKNSHLIKLVALPVDPLSNLKYKHHKIPLSNTNEKNFVPVLHSAPAPLSLEEQKKWKIPPCVNMSNNPKGLVIPLDIRLANDGRNLREYKANKNFAKFADILAMTEKNVRKEIEERNKIAQSIQIAAAMKKEKELKEAAKQARMERKSYTNKNSTNNNSSMVYSLDTSDILNNKEEEGNYLLKNKRERSKDQEEKERKERNELREIRKRDIEYERRLELIKQYEKEGRDINDKILLGQNNMINNNNVIDSRLYELEGGIENPFDYNEDCQVYDKPLFNGKNKLSNIYKNFNSLGGENSKKLMGKILSQKGKLFNSDLEAINSRKEGPVQFEKANKE
jgi:SNW domain-containing protein 1